MNTWIHAATALGGALALAGCCHGPFMYVDCINSGITIHAVDSAGDPIAVDEVQWRIDDGRTESADCWAVDTGGAPGCDQWEIPAYEDGTYTIDLLVDGFVVGSDTVEVAVPESSPGECCGSVFRDEREISVENPVSEA